MRRISFLNGSNASGIVLHGSNGNPMSKACLQKHASLNYGLPTIGWLTLIGCSVTALHKSASAETIN